MRHKFGDPRRCRELVYHVVYTLAHSPDVAVRFAPETPCPRTSGLPGLDLDIVRHQNKDSKFRVKAECRSGNRNC